MRRVDNNGSGTGDAGSGLDAGYSAARALGKRTATAAARPYKQNRTAFNSPAVLCLDDRIRLERRMIRIRFLFHFSLNDLFYFSY